MPCVRFRVCLQKTGKIKQTKRWPKNRSLRKRILLCRFRRNRKWARTTFVPAWKHMPCTTKTSRCSRSVVRFCASVYVGRYQQNKLNAHTVDRVRYGYMEWNENCTKTPCGLMHRSPLFRSENKKCASDHHHPTNHYCRIAFSAVVCVFTFCVRNCILPGNVVR